MEIMNQSRPMSVHQPEGADLKSALRATDAELRKVYNIFTDAWRFYRKYADIRQEDERWAEAINESEAIAKKHQNSQLCRDLLNAAVDDLNRP